MKNKIGGVIYDDSEYIMDEAILENKKYGIPIPSNFDLSNKLKISQKLIALYNSVLTSYQLWICKLTCTQTRVIYLLPPASTIEEVIQCIPKLIFVITDSQIDLREYYSRRDLTLKEFEKKYISLYYILQKIKRCIE